MRLLAVMTKDKVRVAITPPATLRCTTAEAIVHWIRDDVAPIAATLGAPLGGVANFASYECRGRNRIVGAQISEHGKGNALDIRALTLANGRAYELTDIAVAKDGARTVAAQAPARASPRCSGRPRTDFTRAMCMSISPSAAAAFASANGRCATSPISFRCRASGRRKRRRASLDDIGACPNASPHSESR